MVSAIILKNGLVSVSAENPMVPLLIEGVAAFSVVVLELVVVPVLDPELPEHPSTEVSNKTATDA